MYNYCMSKINNPNRRIICGKRLKLLIKSNDEIKTQEKFAELVDVNVRTVKRWVSEGVDSLTTIKKISDLLEIPDSELFMDK